MSILIVGSVAYDGIETPFGKRDRILGGSATYLSLTSSYFCDDVRLVGVVGNDFAQSDIEVFKNKGINTFKVCCVLCDISGKLILDLMYTDGSYLIIYQWQKNNQ